MNAILPDPEDVQLAELEGLMRKLAAAPSEFESQAERDEDENVMANCVAYFRARRLARPIHIKYCDRKTPTWNVSALLSLARDLDVEDVLARNIVAATLQFLLPRKSRKTELVTTNAGDLILGTTCFHVTAAPGSAVIGKCKENARSGLHPVLLVPSALVAKSRHLAEDADAADEITVIAIEDFVATNIIELAEGKQSDFFEILRGIVAAYNRRLEEVETDMSLRIEIK